MDLVPRLTPLGRTCVRQILVSTIQIIRFIKTFDMRGDEELQVSLCRFWEVEHEGTFWKAAMTADEKGAIKLLQDLSNVKMVSLRLGFLGKKILGVYQKIIVWHS